MRERDFFWQWVVVLLALAAPVLADFTQEDVVKATDYCGGGSFISTAVFGIDPDNVRAKARAEIAQSIVSNVKSNIRTKASSGEKDGVLSESSEFLQMGEIESNLTLSGFREIEAPVQQENGEYELKAYVCRSDAAKPWLAAFEAEVAKYSNLAIKIADEKDSQKRNEHLSTAASVKDSANWADIVLSSIIHGSTNMEYAKLKEEFRAAKEKIELATKSIHDKNYGVGPMPIVPGLAQLYKGHYGRAALIIGSGAVLLTVGGICNVTPEKIHFFT
jgi:hypothetical protein